MLFIVVFNESLKTGKIIFPKKLEEFRHLARGSVFLCNNGNVEAAVLAEWLRPFVK